MSNILHGQRKAAFAAALAFAVLAAGAFGSPRSEQIRKHFDEGLRHYQTGRTDEARATFRKMLEMNLTPGEAFALREAVGRSQLVALLAEEPFREEIIRILQLSYEHFEKLRKDAEKVQQYVEDLSDEDNRVVWQAIYSLQRIGPLAVPHLLDLVASLERPHPRSPAIPARIALKNMGRRATVPLVQALLADTRAETPRKQEEAEKRDMQLKMEICRLLAAAPDVRAEAALKRLVECPDTHTLLRDEARQALSAMQADDRPADMAYLALAEMYFNRRPRVVDAVSTFDRIVWRWREGAGPTYRERLTYEIPPDFLYPAMMAQQTLLDAMSAGHDRADLLALYVANNYDMLRLCRLVAENADLERDARREAAALAERLAYVRELNEQLGAQYLYLALDRALANRDRALALDSIAGLRAVADPRPTPESLAIFRALTSTFMAVRCAAAEAIVVAAPCGRILSPANPSNPAKAPESPCCENPGTGGHASAKAGDPQAGADDAETRCKAQAEGGCCNAQDAPAPRRVPEAEVRAQRDPQLVVGALHTLFTAGGRPRILVVSGSRQLYDEAASILKAAGFETELALESSSAIARLKRPIPAVSAVLADWASEPDLAVFFLRRDIRTARIPLVLLAPDEEKEKAAEKFEAPVVPYNEAFAILPTQLRETVQAALAENGPPPLDVEAELLERALQSLLDAPTLAAYPMDKLVPALVALVFEKPSDIGVKSLALLGRIDDARALEPAFQVFLDEDADAGVRTAAGRLVNRLIWRAEDIKPERLEALTALAVGEPGDLRDLAVRAIAKAPLPPESRTRTAVETAEKHLLESLK